MKRIVLMAMVAALAAAPAGAGSIWAKATGPRGTRIVRVYDDDKALGIGDILTIVVAEHSVINHETTRESDKAANRNATASGNINLRDVGMWWGNRNSSFVNPDVGLTSTAGSDFTGNADYETDRLVTDQITVSVVDVLPNGNLVVMGARQRHVDGDTQVLRVSGVVRPSDITFANTVASQRVADFRMIVDVDGPEQLWTKPGWLGRILNFLSPW